MAQLTTVQVGTLVVGLMVLSLSGGAHAGSGVE